MEVVAGAAAAAAAEASEAAVAADGSKVDATTGGTRTPGF